MAILFFFKRRIPSCQKPTLYAEDGKTLFSSVTGGGEIVYVKL